MCRFAFGEPQKVGRVRATQGFAAPTRGGPVRGPGRSRPRETSGGGAAGAGRRGSIDAARARPQRAGDYLLGSGEQVSRLTRGRRSAGATSPIANVLGVT